MNSVIRHIEYLLSNHDCVVVPGLGAFLAKDCPATYDSERGEYVAPSRKFAFNDSLTSSDGMLIMSVSRGKGIDFNSAKKVISECVAKIEDELNTTGEFTFGRIGRLEKSLTGIITFISPSTDRLTPTANWIGRIKVEELGPIGKQNKVTQKLPAPAPFRIPRFIKNAVGAVAAILIAIVISTPVAVKNVTAYKASTVPTVTAPKPVEAPVIAEVTVQDTLLTENNLSATVEQAEDEPAKSHRRSHRESDKETPLKQNSVKDTEKTLKESNAVHFDDTDPYVYVVASLPTYEDALRFISDNSRKTNVRYGIMEGDSRYRVYAATGKTRREAYKNGRKLPSKFPGAWAKKRH